MEAVGLAVGVAALIGTLKDCIDLYLMISADMSPGEDAALLTTKLNAEKRLFFKWADRVGLAKPRKWDRRLDDKDLNTTVAGVLSSIKTLLGEAKALESRYGLERRDLSIDRTSFADVNLPKARASRMEHFFRRFEQVDLNKSTLKGGKESKKLGVKDRCCWVMRDKDKFGQLLQELCYFNPRLHGLVPDTRIQRLKQILKAASGIPCVLEAVQRAIRTAKRKEKSGSSTARV